MMRYQLDDLHSRNEPIAVLTASEAPIYQRFGYGPASLVSGYRFDQKDLSVFDERAVDRKGELRFVDHEVAAKSFPAVFAAYQQTRVGEVSRFPIGWGDTFGSFKNGERPDRFLLTYEEQGVVTGYLVYRVISDQAQRGRRIVRVIDLCSQTSSAYLALWSYLLDLDLVEEVRTGNRPVDEPIRWVLSDYRRMHTDWTSEHTFVRLVEVERALGLRRYHDEGELTLAVSDAFCPWNEGRYRLSVAESGAAEVERMNASGEADLELNSTVLGSIFLGGLRPSALAEVGAVAERRPGALSRADRMFVEARPPFCSTEF